MQFMKQNEVLYFTIIFVSLPTNLLVYMIETRLLTQELWELLIADGGDEVKALKAMKKQAERRGRVKRLLIKAIDKSSVGSFNGSIYYFGGKVYVPMQTKAFCKVLWDLLAFKIELPDSDLGKPYDIYTDCCNAVYAKPLCLSNSIMLFRNGVLDIEAGKFHKRFSKEFVSLYAVDYDYVPGASTFLWYTFLNQVLPDKMMQEVLQMFLGATFIDRAKVKIESIMILLGKGANGKSVVQQTVCGVLGEDYVSTMEVGRLCTRGADGDYAVAGINGKRLNYCTEMEVTDFYRKSARLKALVSGEGVTARMLYGSPFKAGNVPLLMANANELPIFNKKDGALIRRVYIIPFDVTVPPERQNKTLGDELRAEYPGILNWILEGRQKFIDGGYKLPPDVNLGRYIHDEQLEFNSVLKYMENVNGWLPCVENVSLAPLNWKSLTTLYNGYARWCKQNGIQGVSRVIFSHCLENEGGYVKKRFAEGYKFAVYGNITINTLRNDRYKAMRDEAPKTAVMWKDGVAYVSSMLALSEYSGVGVTTIRRLNREGKFKGHTKAYREKVLYEVEACTKILREEGVLATDEEKEIHSRLLKSLKYMRYVFNQRMEYTGLPYRMYGLDEEQIEDDIIKVPDDTTIDEIRVMARKAGYDTKKLDRYKTTPGAFGRGGKGFFEDRSEIPTTIEKRKYYQQRKKNMVKLENEDITV